MRVFMRLLLALSLPLAGALSFVGGPGGAAAQQPPGTGLQPIPPDSEFTPPPPGPLRIGMEVVVDGTPVATVRYGDRIYLPVPRLGAEYQIRVWNHGPRRVVALVSVDGLSVINGQPASDANSGYVVSPSGSVTIKGWRRDLSTVAAFRFVEREKSYAALMGRPEKVGTISLLAIEERVPHPRFRLDRESAGAAAPTAAHRRLGGVGTEYGRDVGSSAYYVPFARSANRSRVTFHYDTVSALREAGVPIDPLPVSAPRWDGEFAPPPPRPLVR